MITEALILGTAGAITYNWDKIKIYKKWSEIVSAKSNFTNKLGKTLKILKIDRKEYGYTLTVELPYSYTKDMLERDLDTFKEGLHFRSIGIKNKNNIVYMDCVEEYNFKDYIPQALPPNKLLISDGLTSNIIVDMNKFPHLLLGGDTGTGKSRILLLILTNLIKHCRNNVELYLLQVRKNDLGVFKNCKQVKICSRTLEEVLESLKSIDKECKNRESLIDNEKGYYNIEDYNKENKKLKYIYVVIEEFSFLNISKGDSKEEKKLKSECLKHIKMIVNVGRSSGVFLITALQKPTSDSIPSDIKAQLCTRVALRLSDIPTSIVILGNDHASKLDDREMIVRTVNEEIGYSYTIDHSIVMNNIKDCIVKKKEVPQIKEEPTINDILSLL